MKSLRFLFALCVLTSLFFTSCVEENPILEKQQPADDTELVSALFDSDELVGIGEVKESEESDKYSFTVRTDELSQDLQDQLDGKESWAFDNKLSISPDVMKRIWGEKIKDTEIENGFDFEAKEYIVHDTYMTPDGESLTEQVENDPSILANARDVYAYLYVEVNVEVEVTIYGDGSVTVEVDIDVYVEACVIVTP